MLCANEARRGAGGEGEGRGRMWNEGRQEESTIMYIVFHSARMKYNIH